MRISEKYEAAHWKALKFKCEKDWEQGIAIFVDRIQGRFFNFVDKIKDDTYAGFAVMALDCLLIETLQQFREGVEESSIVVNGRTKGQSKEFFKRFLTKTSFKKYFNDDMAVIFFKKIRCGILHQAEIKGDSRIRICKSDPLVKKTDNEGLIINRQLFHMQLEEVFREYVEDLRDPANSDLREKFKNKMNFICASGGEI